MDEPQRVQEFLEEFRFNNENRKIYCYGIGRHTTLAPFLFEYPIRSSAPLLLRGISPFSNFEVASSNTFKNFTIYHEDLNSDGYSTSLISMFYCYADMHTKRISPHSFSCTLCQQTGSKNHIISHILKDHQDQIKKQLEPYVDYVSDDKEFLKGMLTKLQFDAIIKRSSKPQFELHSIMGNTTAPSLDTLETDTDSYEEDDIEFESDDDDDIGSYLGPQSTNVSKRKSPIELLYKSEVSPALTLFAKAHDPNYHSFYEPTTLDPFPVTMSSSQIIHPYVDSYLQYNDTFHGDVSLLDSFPEEEETKPKQTKPKPPETVSYINIIPQNLRDKIISNIAKQLITSYATNNCGQNVRSIFQVKKKQIQKQLREEKAQRQRNEEKQRLMAMRERRKVKVEQMSEKLSNTIVNIYIRNVIKNIYLEEVEAEDKNENEPNEEITNQLNTEYSNVVVVSNLVLQHQLNPTFLSKAFGNLNFQLEGESERKIRFRCCGNHVQALLFLASYEEVKKALASNPVMIEYSQAYLSRYEENNDDGMMLFTGQQVKMLSVKNPESIENDGGSSELTKINPCMDLDLINDGLEC
ncbi:hypothetical protein GPJ56_003650 [Histomonas meleagridis]|uniref:uncharacterized protein n=1 Tax=Histomonas meleagridis TaxID=135588 RepID=UPI0035596776|nr:hypothetical protein GPJ56_003650 [Histomonas meleagridis]KAH0800721.1 hypothetical protein GO595_006474 [Histomonas meleagridis]